MDNTLIHTSRNTLKMRTSPAELIQRGCCHPTPEASATVNRQSPRVSGLIPLFLKHVTNRVSSSAAGMQMTFTTSFKGVPILFDQWAPQTTAAFALSWLAIFLSAIGMRGLIFIRAYLSTEHWGKVVRHWMLLKTRSKPARQVVRYGLKHSGQFSHSSWRSFPTL